MIEKTRRKFTNCLLLGGLGPSHYSESDANKLDVLIIRYILPLNMTTPDNHVDSDSRTRLQYYHDTGS